MNQIERMINCWEMDIEDPRCWGCKNTFAICDLDVLEDCEYIEEEL